MDESERAIVDQIIKDLTFTNPKSKRSTSFDENPHKPSKTPTPASKRRNSGPLSRAVNARYPTLKPFGDFSIGRPSRVKRKPPAIVFASPDPDEKEPSRYVFPPEILTPSANPPETPKPRRLATAPSSEYSSLSTSPYQNSLHSSEHPGKPDHSLYHITSRKPIESLPGLSLPQPLRRGQASVTLSSSLARLDAQGPPFSGHTHHKRTPSELAAPTLLKQESVSTTNRFPQLSEIYLDSLGHWTTPAPPKSPPIARPVTCPQPLENGLFSTSTHSLPVQSAAPAMSADNLLNPASAQAGAFGISKSKIVAAAEKQQAIVLEKAKKLNVPPPPYKLLELVGKGSFGLVFKAYVTAGFAE
ncbi:MAG: hypothetical protein M1840_003427 [Geoglossum simile]|nr:MAG: hypothetical protein M1840_003427 [Geoglossum simile]